MSFRWDALCPQGAYSLQSPRRLFGGIWVVRFDSSTRLHLAFKVHIKTRVVPTCPISASCHLPFLPPASPALSRHSDLSFYSLTWRKEQGWRAVREVCQQCQGQLSDFSYIQDKGEEGLPHSRSGSKKQHLHMDDVTDLTLQHHLPASTTTVETHLFPAMESRRQK